jgi:hypothetical protein
VAQKSPQVYHRKPYHSFGTGLVIYNFSPVSVRPSCGAPVLQKLRSPHDDADKQARQ